MHHGNDILHDELFSDILDASVFFLFLSNSGGQVMYASIAAAGLCIVVIVTGIFIACILLYKRSEFL